MCCKLFPIDWLEAPKPAGQWCAHCTPGKGCGIWQVRPQGCVDYHCIWRLDAALGPEWRPDRARFILNHDRADAPLSVVIDPATPQAHRRAPYAAQLQKTTRHLLETQGKPLLLLCGEARAVLMPDGEVVLPAGLDLHHVRIERHERAGARFWRAIF